MGTRALPRQCSSIQLCASFWLRAAFKNSPPQPFTAGRLLLSHVLLGAHSLKFDLRGLGCSRFRTQHCECDIRCRTDKMPLKGPEDACNDVFPSHTLMDRQKVTLLTAGGDGVLQAAVARAGEGAGAVRGRFQALPGRCSVCQPW